MVRGPVPTLIAAPAVFVAVSIGVTVSPVSWLELATYAVAPPGVIAMASGPVPAGIAGSALPVAMLIGVTALPPVSVTYAVLPSGVIAMPAGVCPTLIGLPA